MKSGAPTCTELADKHQGPKEDLSTRRRQWKKSSDDKSKKRPTTGIFFLESVNAWYQTRSDLCLSLDQDERTREPTGYGQASPEKRPAAAGTGRQRADPTGTGRQLVDPAVHDWIGATGSQRQAGAVTKQAGGGQALQGTGAGTSCSRHGDGGLDRGKHNKMDNKWRNNKKEESR
jgi:hypothetical protein